MGSKMAALQWSQKIWTWVIDFSSKRFAIVPSTKSNPTPWNLQHKYRRILFNQVEMFEMNWGHLRKLPIPMRYLYQSGHESTADGLTGKSDTFQTHDPPYPIVNSEATTSPMEPRGLRLSPHTHPKEAATIVSKILTKVGAGVWVFSNVDVSKEERQ